MALQVISQEHAIAVCTKWSCLADEQGRATQSLKASGFAAFIPRQTYTESFANSFEDVAIHKKCTIEFAREWISKTRKGGSPVVKSSFLDELRSKQREANDGDAGRALVSQSDQTFLLRFIDPCERELWRVRMQDHEASEARFAAMQSSERVALRIEATKHQTSLSTRHGFDVEGRFSAVADYHDEFSGRLGFKYDSRRSKPMRPVFCKHVSESWDWTLSVDTRFIGLNAAEGAYEPRLILVNRRTRSAEPANPEHMLELRYQWIVDKFSSGYRLFRSHGELEVCAKAHLHLIGEVLPYAEGAVIEVMES